MYTRIVKNTAEIQWLFACTDAGTDRRTRVVPKNARHAVNTQLCELLNEGNGRTNWGNSPLRHYRFGPSNRAASGNLLLEYGNRDRTAH